MKPVLDLNLRHWSREQGDLILVGTWVVIDGRHRPCMVIVPSDDQSFERSAPCIVTADKAWIWDETIGDPRLAAQTVAAFMKSLRMEPSKPNLFRILSLIHDHLGDLLHIPPYQAQKGEAVADMQITHRGSGKSKEVTIYDV